METIDLSSLRLLYPRICTLTPNSNVSVTMVGINEVRKSNVALHAREGDFVAVFVGGTSGIGEATAKELAKTIKKPTIHLVGRNQAAGSKILEELKSANPDGTFHFIQSDVSLLRNVDEACSEIKQKEKAIDLLFLSTGHLAASKQSKESHTHPSFEYVAANCKVRYKRRPRKQSCPPLLLPHALRPQSPPAAQRIQSPSSCRERPSCRPGR